MEAKKYDRFGKAWDQLAPCRLRTNYPTDRGKKKVDKFIHKLGDKSKIIKSSSQSLIFIPSFEQPVLDQR